MQQQRSFCYSWLNWNLKEYDVPAFLCRCELLGVCETYGMPSTHTQVVAYLLGVVLVQRLFQTSSQASKFKIHHVQELIECVVLMVLTGTTAYARFYLGYHTSLQVALGAVVGILFGICWSVLCASLLANSSLPRDWVSSVFGVIFDDDSHKSRTL